MHARARPRRTRNACAAGVQKWRFAGVETALPCPPGCVRAWLTVPWSLSTLPTRIRRSQRLLRSFWRLGDRDFRQPTSALSRPKRRPAGQTGVFKLLQTTLYFDLHRSNACCLLHITISEDPEQIAVFNSPVLQQ